MTKYIIKRDTRHFAKRQLTWFKRERDVTWVNYPDYKNDKEKMLEAMLEICKAKNIL
jgi:tRNA dimethylallyltransferase